LNKQHVIEVLLYNCRHIIRLASEYTLAWWWPIRFDIYVRIIMWCKILIGAVVMWTLQKLVVCLCMKLSL